MASHLHDHSLQTSDKVCQTESFSSRSCVFHVVIIDCSGIIAQNLFHLIYRVGQIEPRTVSRELECRVHSRSAIFVFQPSWEWIKIAHARTSWMNRAGAFWIQKSAWDMSPVICLRFIFFSFYVDRGHQNIIWRWPCLLPGGNQGLIFDKVWCLLIF